MPIDDGFALMGRVTPVPFRFLKQRCGCINKMEHYSDFVGDYILDRRIQNEAIAAAPESRVTQSEPRVTW